MDSNVNNLDGVANFGHGLPADGVVEAGITDVPQAESTEEITEVEEAPEVETEEEGSEEAVELPTQE